MNVFMRAIFLISSAKARIILSWLTTIESRLVSDAELVELLLVDAEVEPEFPSKLVVDELLLDHAPLCSAKSSLLEVE